ncbi:Echinoderm microtubule-associated protein-like 3 [Ataeniobius toweri]|uniref:Echinoderm microtubule-associated protein-like 3 n=1 Tax=Ataeniobius toweri TaxID=208326 RepID=A0ABU7A6P7_9TELE|nr:Echinoderm microtubule-associated protein-like 3 [Ataeniobius toweri]
MQACVHIWDSTTLVTLQQIGLGTFQRGVGVGSLAFSIADSGAFLCVIDDSNEHILSVWDCTKGTKHAEIKVNKDCEVEVNSPAIQALISLITSTIHLRSSCSFLKGR